MTISTEVSISQHPHDIFFSNNISLKLTFIVQSHLIKITHHRLFIAFKSSFTWKNIQKIASHTINVVRNEILKIWETDLLPLLSFFKQILHPVSAVNGCQIIGLESLVGKGFWNQRWNVSQEKLFGMIIKKDAPLFCFKFWLRSTLKSHVSIIFYIWNIRHQKLLHTRGRCVNTFSRNRYIIKIMQNKKAYSV